MLTGYKSYIGLCVWAVGAVIMEFFSSTSMAGFGPPLMEVGKIIFGGGMVAKAVRFMKSQNVK